MTEDGPYYLTIRPLDADHQAWKCIFFSTDAEAVIRRMAYLAKRFERARPQLELSVAADAVLSTRQREAYLEDLRRTGALPGL